MAAGEIDVTQMTRAILGPMLTSLAVGEALVFLPNVGEAFEAMDDLLHKLRPEDGSLLKKGEQKLLRNIAINSIEFKDVCFSYPTRPGRVLSHFNLRLLLDGKRVALVGPSGGGKSTIVSLILRLYGVDSGELLLNDSINVETLQLESYRSRIGYVGQEPVLFDQSLRENVLFGVDKELTQKEEEFLLETLAERARLDFVESVGEWESNLGPRGSKLSGGQKQRVAIARAIAREPEILLMDEATSALDSVSESVVQDAVKGLLDSKTCRGVIVIAHRLSTVVNSDVIVVVQNGKVVQIGSHESLIKEEQGQYFKLYTAGL